MNEPLLMQVNELLKGCHFQWAFCGGYAIDLLLNQTTRKHGDIDICVFEDDRESIIDHMLTTGWNVYQFLGGGKVRRILPGDASDNGRNLMCVKDNCALVTFHPCDENNIFWYEFHHTGIEKLDYLEFMFNQTDGNELVITSAPMAKRPLKKRSFTMVLSRIWPLKLHCCIKPPMQTNRNISRIMNIPSLA